MGLSSNENGRVGTGVWKYDCGNGIGTELEWERESVGMRM